MVDFTMVEVLVVGTIVCAAAAVLVGRLVRFVRGARPTSDGSGCPTCPGCSGTVESADGASCDPVDCPVERVADTLRKGSVGPSLIVPLLLGLSVLAADARAVDTMEPFDAGMADAELYFGFDGIGLPEHQKTLLADMLVGYGVIHRLSLFAGATLQSDESVSTGETALQLGILGTPLDTDHVDIDLVLALSIGGPGFDEVRGSPFAELNLDSQPDMSGWGLYLRAGVPVYGRKRGGGGGTSGRAETAVDAELTFGAYLSIAEIHQLLFEYVLAFHPSPAEGDTGTELGAAALGYNVTLSDAFELINQLHLDVPQEGEAVAFGMVIGLIATFGLL